MRGILFRATLISSVLGLMCVGLSTASAGAAVGHEGHAAKAATTTATATSTAACTFNGINFPIIRNVTDGSTVAIACTGLPALTPYLIFQASLLIGIDPAAEALLAGGAPGPGTVTGALAALPVIDAASFSFATSDENGDLSYTYTVPSIQATDPNANCPPNLEEYNSGLIGCALAMVNLTTQAEEPAGSGVLQWVGYNEFPDNPTLALTPDHAKPGKTVTVSDATGATTYWWLATLDALEGSGPATLLVSEQVSKNDYVPVKSSDFDITVTPATYNGSTFTPPTISGTFTVPKHFSGTHNVFIVMLSPLGLDIVAHASLKA
jgi:hypothetical protein